MISETADVEAAGEQPLGPPEPAPRPGGRNNRLSWVRAGVLGANDGIVSTAGIVVGVAGATAARSSILVAGIAGLVAGAMSMAAGEYVSVSTQRDADRALLEEERRELAEAPDAELLELAAFYVEKGLSHQLARDVAVELTERDALAAHAEVEHRIDPHDLTNPWAAALASMVSFTLGALLPLLTILLPMTSRIPATFTAVALALVVTGRVSASLAGGSIRRAVVRNVLGGVLAMLVTFAIGSLVGTQL